VPPRKERRAPPGESQAPGEAEGRMTLLPFVPLFLIVAVIAVGHVLTNTQEN
jgi:hypothetical protein